MIDLTNWLKRDGDGSVPTYYGYAMPGTTDSDNKWLIRRLTGSTSGDEFQFADNDFMFDGIWGNRTLYFETPVSAVTLSNSAATSQFINVQWDLIPGVAKYYVTVKKAGDTATVAPWSEKLSKTPVAQIEKGLETNTSYDITVRAWNRAGQTSTTWRISTLGETLRTY